MDVKSFIFYEQSFNYWIAGIETNPPLLLIPGLTGSHSDLIEFSDYLRKDFFVILPDLPGWGSSPTVNAKLTIEFYADFIKDCIEKNGFKQVHVLGHCMGSTIAIQLAYQFPHLIKKLFLVSVPYEEGTNGYKVIRWLTNNGEKVPRFLKPLFYFWRSPLINVISGFFILKFRSLRKKTHTVINNFITQIISGDKNFYEPWICLMNYDYMRARNLSKNIETHLIFGSQDLLIPYAQARKFHDIIGSKATLDFIEDAGHLPPVETPSELSKLVIQHLKT